MALALGWQALAMGLEVLVMCEGSDSHQWPTRAHSPLLVAGRGRGHHPSTIKRKEETKEINKKI